MTPLQRAIEICGSQSELARRIGGKVKPGHIHYWLKNSVSAEACVGIERATHGAVSRHDLRPDLFGPSPSNSANAAAAPAAPAQQQPGGDAAKVA